MLCLDGGVIMRVGFLARGWAYTMEKGFIFAFHHGVGTKFAKQIPRMAWTLLTLSLLHSFPRYQSHAAHQLKFCSFIFCILGPTDIYDSSTVAEAQIYESAYCSKN